MSFDSLRIGASGVSAAQKGVDVAGHNVANVNTEGYTRQRTVQSAAPPARGAFGVSGDGMRGTGVTVTDLQRLRSAFADNAWRSQASVAADAQATATLLTRVENLLGDLDSGLPDATNQLYASFSALALTPTDPAARLGVIAAGQTLASELNTVAAELRQIGPDTTSKAVDVVTRVNTLTGEIATLNRSIADAITTGQQPSDLLDTRDRALDELSQLVGARVGTPDAQGRVDVFLGGEPLVRSSSAAQLKVTPTAAGPTVAFTDDRPAKLGGELGGLIETATVTIPQILAGFDTWAVDLMGMVNTAHMAGYGSDGGTGRTFFTGAGAGDIAVSSTLTPAQVAASASGAVADGNNALTLAQLRDVRAADGTTIGDRLRGHFSHIGLVAQQAQVMASASSRVQDGLDLARVSEHTVSVDEEMVDMVRFQRAYEAAARVITIADQLLDTLINRTAR